MISQPDVTLPANWPPPLGALVPYAEQAMTNAGYSPFTIHSYRRYWQCAITHAQHMGHDAPLTNAFIEDWFAAEGYPIMDWPRPHPVRLAHMLTSVRALVQVHEFGTIVPGRILPPVYRFAQAGHPSDGTSITVLGQTAGQTRLAALPTAFQEAFACYAQDCRVRGLRAPSFINAQQYLTRFFAYLVTQGVDEVTAITAHHLSDFLTSLAHLAPRTVANYNSTLRCWLRVLARLGVLTEEMSRWVPPATIRHYPRIPTVWSPEEVTRLLAQVDRNSPRGKRDYAILLLAARVGLRVGDIIRLTLDDLKWEQKRIELLQSKTGQPLVVPLLDDLGWALIDYLKHGRPVTAYRQLFLRLHPPYAPFVSHDNLHHVITRYRLMAGIQRYQRQPVGMHTLRHSLATQLLADETPLSTIAEVLGHVNQTSTEVYAKVDLPHLRQCPLDPEEVGHVSA